MVKLDALALHPEHVESGRWFDWMRGARVRVASQRSRKFRERLAELREPFSGILQMASGSPEARKIIRDTTAQALSECLLLDWSGIEDADGNPIPYTPEIGRTVLADPKYVHLSDLVATLAATDESFVGAGDVDPSGNSDGSPDGSGDTATT